MSTVGWITRMSRPRDTVGHIRTLVSLCTSIGLACTAPSLAESGQPTVNPLDHAHGGQAGVAIAINVLDTQQQEAKFHRVLTHKGVVPLLVDITNNSNQTYVLNQAHIELDRLSPTEIAQLFPQREAGPSMRVVSRLMGVILLPVVIVGFLLSGLSGEQGLESLRPLALLDPLGAESASAESRNQDLLYTFQRHELQDITLKPGYSTRGVLYARNVQRGRAVRVTFVNADTGQPVTIDMRF